MITQALILASSLPPLLRGQALAPNNLNSYQQRVLASWRMVGCSFMSMHTSTELTAQPGHAELLRRAGVDVLELQQTDAEHLPNLHSSLTALSEAHPQALIALTNADILIKPYGGLPQILQSIRPDQAVVGRRSNVEFNLDGDISPEGQHDIYGFDFFAFHTTALRQALPLIPESLVFGRPWWDLFLPLALLASGLQLIDPGPDLFLHPHHEERWSAEQWFRHGQAADQRFFELLHTHGRHAFARRWRRQRRRFLRRWPGLTGVRHRLREQRRSLLAEGRLLPLHLSDVSDAINDLVDRELARTAPA